MAASPVALSNSGDNVNEQSLATDKLTELIQELDDCAFEICTNSNAYAYTNAQTVFNLVMRFGV